VRVAKLKGARTVRSADTGKCEGAGEVECCLVTGAGGENSKYFLHDD
jgi:hypothetical protein